MIKIKMNSTFALFSPASCQLKYVSILSKKDKKNAITASLEPQDFISR